VICIIGAVTLILNPTMRKDYVEGFEEGAKGQKGGKGGKGKGKGKGKKK
jgi:hypothetical protein